MDKIKQKLNIKVGKLGNDIENIDLEEKDVNRLERIKNEEKVMEQFESKINKINDCKYLKDN